MTSPETTPAPAPSVGAVFVSYASQDAEAAKRICESLRAAGVEVWFDQNELTGGDAWDRKIRGQIAACALFVPVISAATQARHEGYFRLEWKLAAQRTHLMSGAKAFLLPVVIDATRDAEAHVPEEFRAVQWTRLPGGEHAEKFGERVKNLFGGDALDVGRGLPAPPLRSRNDAATTAGSGDPALQPSRPLRRWLVPALLGAVIVAALALWQPWRPTPPTSAPATAKSIAVLPFVNQSDDKGNEYFSDGISEELLNVLAKIPGLKVTARTSAFYFKGKEVPIPEIAQKLGVAYVVEGSVRKVGTQVRIAAQLIKAADGFQVWTDSFTRELKDIFAVQDEIAGLIAKNLELKMGMASSVTRREVKPEAYRLLLQARFFAQRENRDGRLRSLEYYRRAIVEDPGYAQAWGELARVYAMLARYGDLPMQEGIGEARTAAERALELNPAEPSGSNALGWVQRLADWDWHGARKSFARALALAPDDPTFLSDDAVILWNTGQEDEAITLARRAIERDPLSARAHCTLGELLSMANRDAESVQIFSRAIELSPELEAYHALRATNLCRLQRYAEAEASLAGEPNEGFRLMAESVNARQRGDLVASVKARGELIARHGARMVGWIGLVYAHQGENDQAFAWLERAAREHDRMIPWMRNHNYLRGLHADPRWPVFLKKIGLSDEQLK